MKGISAWFNPLSPIVISEVSRRGLIGAELPIPSKQAIRSKIDSDRSESHCEKVTFKLAVRRSFRRENDSVPRVSASQITRRPTTLDLHAT